jgi:ParB/RepB/Spo0J family partition protein
MSTVTDSAVSQVVRIRLDLVHPDPKNPRVTLGDLTEITASIREGGVRQPAIVYAHPDRAGEWMVLFGHRRRQASIDAGLRDLPCVIVPDPGTDLAAIDSHSLGADEQED